MASAGLKILCELDCIFWLGRICVVGDERCMVESEGFEVSVVLVPLVAFIASVRLLASDLVIEWFRFGHSWNVASILIDFETLEGHRPGSLSRFSKIYEVGSIIRFGGLGNSQSLL